MSPHLRVVAGPAQPPPSSCPSCRAGSTSRRGSASTTVSPAVLQATPEYGSLGDLQRPAEIRDPRALAKNVLP